MYLKNITVVPFVETTGRLVVSVGVQVDGIINIATPINMFLHYDVSNIQIQKLDG